MKYAKPAKNIFKECVHVSTLFGLLFCIKIKNKQQTPWSESASQLHRTCDLRLLAKLVPTFADREVSRSQRGVSPIAVISVL
jgi:hypothetical protein